MADDGPEDFDFDALTQNVHMKLQFEVTEDGNTETVTMWEGSGTDFIFDGPRMMLALAISMKERQRAFGRGENW
jgi:hypothetical protein